MVVRIDFKDGTFSWHVGDSEVHLNSGNSAELGVPIKGTAPTETEAMRAGVEAIREIKKRREMASHYPKTIEVM